MKYLKLVNVHLGDLLRRSKYGSSTDKINWEFIGLKPKEIQALSVNTDAALYLPINDQLKLDDMLSSLQSDTDGDITVVDDDRNTWVASINKKPDDKQIISNGFIYNGNTFPIEDFLYFTQLIRAGKASLLDTDVTTETLTVIHTVGTVEMDITDVNKVLAALETIYSNSLKVRAGVVSIDDIVTPLIIS